MIREKVYKTDYNMPIRRFREVEDSNINNNLDERAKKYWASKNYKKEEVSYEPISSINPRIP